MNRFFVCALLILIDTAYATDQIPAPKIPDKTFTITDFGAKDNADSTDAIKKAIAACKEAGGGIVRIPSGKFIFSPFELFDNMNLHLDEGATLMLSNDMEKLPMKNTRYIDGITASDAHDIAITGKGTIDGQGENWWNKYRKRPDGTDPRTTLPHRPFLIALDKIERLRVEGVTLQNSPMFHLVPRNCRDVEISNLKILAPENAPNTDGIDPSGLNYWIHDVHFDTGDDCIALKPNRASYEGRVACEDFLIEHCTFLHGHGMSIGGQTPGGLKRMIVRDCTFESTDAGIRMKAPRGDGGLVEDVSYENLKMKDVKNPIMITSYYPSIPKIVQDDPAQPITPRTPIWRNICITNVTSEGGEQSNILGLPEQPVEGVILTNVKISDKKPMRIINAKGIVFKDSQVKTEADKNFIVANSQVSGIDPEK